MAARLSHRLWLLAEFRSGDVGLDLARAVKGLLLVQNLDGLEPVVEARQGLDVVSVGGALQQLDLEGTRVAARRQVAQVA